MNKVKRGLIFGWAAGMAVAKYRIVKPGADQFHVTQAAGPTDKLLGVVEYGAEAAEDMLDVTMTGSTEVEYGGVVALGDKLTSDADGKAVVAAAGDNVVGVALCDGVTGDVGSVLISLGTA